MSEGERNLGLAKAGLDAFRRGDIEGFLDTMDSQIDVFSTPELPNPGRFVGPEGFLEWSSQWLDAWETFEVEPLEFQAVGEHHVLLQVRQRGIGRESGIEVEMAAWYMLEYRNGLGTRIHLYASREQALEAAWAGEKAPAD